MADNPYRYFNVQAAQVQDQAKADKLGRVIDGWYDQVAQFAAAAIQQQTLQGALYGQQSALLPDEQGQRPGITAWIPTVEPKELGPSDYVFRAGDYGLMVADEPGVLKPEPRPTCACGQTVWNERATRHWGIPVCGDCYMGVERDLEPGDHGEPLDARIAEVEPESPPPRKPWDWDCWATSGDES